MSSSWLPQDKRGYVTNEYLVCFIVTKTRSMHNVPFNMEHVINKNHYLQITDHDTESVKYKQIMSADINT